jgi:hypothetical protein
MDFWKSLTAQDDESNNRDAANEPTFLQKLTDFVKDEAKDEALSSAVEFLTDGWFTYDGGDDEDEEPQSKKKPEESGTFEERLQRSLAELQQQAAAPAAPPPPAEVPLPPVDLPVTPIESPAPRQTLRPPMRGPGGFGRKGL